MNVPLWGNPENNYSALEIISLKAAKATGAFVIFYICQTRFLDIRSYV